MSQRVAKLLARTGLCSRREGEHWVREGRVRLNGVQLASPAANASEADSLEVDGRRVRLAAARQRPRVFVAHKLPGELVTRSDPAGRRTIFERFRAMGLADVLMPVGRLDMMSEGLLLLTDDGELARLLELPSSGLRRVYRARVHGRVTPKKLEAMRRGVTTSDGWRFSPMTVAADASKGTHTWLSISCTEGKQRMVRRVCSHLALDVNRLIRTQYGPYELGELSRGSVREVRPHVSLMRRLAELRGDLSNAGVH